MTNHIVTERDEPCSELVLVLDPSIPWVRISKGSSWIQILKASKELTGIHSLPEHPYVGERSMKALRYAAFEPMTSRDEQKAGQYRTGISRRKDLYQYISADHISLLKPGLVP